MRQFAITILVYSLAAAACWAQDPALQITMNDEAKFIVSGSNVSTLGLQFHSDSASLATVPLNADGAGDPAPFSFFLNNGPQEITYGTLPPTVTIDGSVQLSSGWNSLGFKDVVYSYGEAGIVAGPFSVAADAYQGICADCVAPPLQPITVQLTPEFDFQLMGSGHQLRSFQFQSPTSSLRPATSSAPFSSLTSNNAELIRYEQAGDNVLLNGTLTLNSGWNSFRGGRDIEFQYEVAEGQDVATGPFPILRAEYPPFVSYRSIDVRFNDDALAVLSGTGQPLTNFTLTSPSNSLVPANNPAPFATVTGDDGAVTYTAAENTAVTLDGELTLGTGWKFGEPGVQRDVRTSYNFAGNPVARSGRVRDYPAEINWPTIRVSIDSEDQFVLNGSGHPLRQFDLTSRTGSLIPSETLGPFASFGLNTSSEVNYLANENVVLDGSLTVATKWDRDGERDVRYEYDLDKVSNNTSLNVSSREYPSVPVCFDGNSSHGLAVSVDKRNRIVLTGDGHKLDGLALSSESSSIVPGESPSPFESFGANTPALVEMASNEMVTIDGSVILSAEFENEEGVQDLVVDFGSAALPHSVYPTCFDSSGPLNPPIDGGGDNPGPGFSGELTILVDDGGQIAVIGGPADLSGFDLTSADGNLIPVEGNDASPFTFFLSNTENQITWGNLGSTFRVDGVWLTGAAYAGDDPENDLNGSWGNGATPVGLPVLAGDFDQSLFDGGFLPVVDPPVFGNETIPEPNASLLFCFGLAGLSLLRKKSRHSRSETVSHAVTTEIVATQPAAHGGGRTSFNAMTFVTMIGCLLSVFTVNSSARAQEALAAFLNEDSKFVIRSTGDDFSTIGLDFRSPSGSLVPTPDTDASPFTFFLANTANQITYGNLGSQVRFARDSEVTLRSGWDPTGTRDVVFSYGDGDQSVGPNPLPDLAYDGICTNCFPVTTTFDDQNRFVISGVGQNLLGITLTSPSGSLRPGTDPSSFASVMGTPESVTYTAPDGSLTLEGSLALDTQWAFGEIGSARDVEFSYRLLDDDGTTRTFQVDRNAYPERPLINVALNDQSQFVLNGQGHPVSNVSFNSPSNSIITSTDAAPFATVTTENGVSYSAAADSPVVLDGQLTLSSKWAFGENGSRADVSYSYNLADDSETFRSFLPSSVYPQELRWDAIAVSLDDQDKFVLTGNGQPLRQFNLSSRSGSLIPSEVPGPFEEANAIGSNIVSYQSAENVVLDGSLTLDAAWDRLGDKDVRYNYDLDLVSNNVSGSVPNSAYPSVPISLDGRVNEIRVYIDRRNRFVLSGEGHQLTQLELSSESGALVPGESAAPFESFDSNTEQSVQFASNELITIDGTVILSTEWNPEIGTRDVEIDLGEVILPESSFPRSFETGTGGGTPVVGGGGGGGVDPGQLGNVFAVINSDQSISIIGDGVSAAGIDIVSAGGHLVPVPGTDASPFTFFLANTNTQITWGNLGSNVLLDGEWKTNAGYTGTDPVSDLTLAWGMGATPVRFPVSFAGESHAVFVPSDASVPEPASSLLMLSGLLAVLGFRKRRSVVSHS